MVQLGQRSGTAACQLPQHPQPPLGTLPTLHPHPPPLRPAHLAKHDFAEEVVAHCVCAVRAHQRRRLQHVAQALAHLQAVLGEEAVAVDAARHRQARAHQHGGPVHGVEAQDVLADDVQRGGPAGGGQGLGAAARALRQQA